MDDTDDEILYHYTSIDGLNSIVQSRKVWASDCRFLNDTQELVKAVNLFLSRLDPDPTVKDALSAALHWQSFSRSPCIFSLSGSPKVLSQWRSYGDDGKGAAIGFKKKFLEDSTFARQYMALVPCVYDGHDYYIDSIINSRSSTLDFRLLADLYKETTLDSFLHALDEPPYTDIIWGIYILLLMLKNEAFIEEQEHRMIIGAPKVDVKTRVSNGLIVPYVEHELCPCNAKEDFSSLAPEIWLGPKSDRRNVKAISAFMPYSAILSGQIHRYDCGYI